MDDYICEYQQHLLTANNDTILVSFLVIDTELSREQCLAVQNLAIIGCALTSW